MKLSEGKYVETIVTAYVEEGRERGEFGSFVLRKKAGNGFLCLKEERSPTN